MDSSEQEEIVIKHTLNYVFGNKCCQMEQYYNVLCMYIIHVLATETLTNFDCYTHLLKIECDHQNNNVIYFFNSLSRVQQEQTRQYTLLIWTPQP